MTSNLTYYEAVLKEDYAPVVYNQFKRNKPLLEKLEASSEFLDAGGRYYYVPLNLAPSQSVGTVSEYGTVGAPKRTTSKGATYFSRIQYAILTFSQREIDSTRSAEDAWQNIRRMEIESVLENLRQNCNRQLYGDGTGKLATCATTTGSTTINVDTTKYIKKDMLIDVIDTDDADAEEYADLTVLTVPSATTFTTATTATTDSSHIIVRAGSNDNEWNGLENIIADSGSLGGVDPATAGYEEWAAYVDNTSTSVANQTIQTLFDGVEKKGGKVDLLMASYGVYRAMANYLESQKRIQVEGAVKLQGGLSGLYWNGVETFKDNDCPAKHLYAIDYDALKFAEITKGGWMTVGGGGGEEGRILHWIPRTTTYEAQWIWDSNLIAVFRNRLGKMTNLTEV